MSKTYHSYAEAIKDLFPSTGDHILRHNCYNCADRCEQEHETCPKAKS